MLVAPFGTGKPAFELAERYETALMANDLPTLDRMFLQSSHVVRLGVGENLYGIESIAAFGPPSLAALRRGGSSERRSAALERTWASSTSSFSASAR